MKRILIIILSLVYLQLSSQGLLWAKSIQGKNSDDVANDIAVDAFGNVYTTGYFADTVDFDPGPGVYNLITSKGDIFISKLDPSGNFVWAKQIGGTSIFNSGESLTVDGSGNVYVTGYFSGTADFDPGPGILNLSASSQDIFVFKLNTSGVLVWAKSFTGINNINYGSSVSVDASGNVYTTGGFETTVDFDPGPGTFTLSPFGSIFNYDIFLSKLDASGSFVWVKSIGNSGNDKGIDIKLDASGDVLMSGIFDGDVDFDTGVGTYSLSAIGQSGFLNKLDASGNFIWAENVGLIGVLAVDAVNNIYTVGQYVGTVDFDPGVGIYNLSSVSGSYDAFVTKFNASGIFVWAKSFGGTLTDFATGITLDASNNLYISGCFNDTVDFDPSVSTYTLIANASNKDDIFCMKLTTSGNFIWAKGMGGNLEDQPHSLILDASGNVCITGHFNGTCDFDPTPANFNITSAGYKDAFILKLSSAVGIEENFLSTNESYSFPNPSNGLFYLKFTKGDKNRKVVLVDVLGQIVFEQKCEEEINKIDVSQLSNGIYVYEIHEERAFRFKGKLIKE